MERLLGGSMFDRVWMKETQKKDYYIAQEKGCFLTFQMTQQFAAASLLPVY